MNAFFILKICISLNKFKTPKAKNKTQSFLKMAATDCHVNFRKEENSGPKDIHHIAQKIASRLMHTPNS
jgi:hypothetical protein